MNVFQAVLKADIWERRDRRRLLTIVLHLHRLGELLHYTP